MFTCLGDNDKKPVESFCNGRVDCGDASDETCGKYDYFQLFRNHAYLRIIGI